MLKGGYEQFGRCIGVKREYMSNWEYTQFKWYVRGAQFKWYTRGVQFKWCTIMKYLNCSTPSPKSK